MVSLKNTVYSYGLIARILHWVSVTLLVTLIIVSGQFEELADGAARGELVQLHSSFGLLFLLLMGLRFYWRQINLNPIHSYQIAPWQKYIAVRLHRLIYILLIWQCVLGGLMLAFSGEVFSFFGFEMGSGISGQEALKKGAGQLHSVLSEVVYPLIALHIGGALYHQIFGVVDKD